MIKLLIQITVLYFKLIFKLIAWPFKFVFGAFREEHDSYVNDDFASRYTPPSFDNEPSAVRRSSPVATKIKPFGDWPTYIHEEPEQITRQLRAMDAQYVPITIDRSGQYGTFRGSNGEEYRTTLEECDCMDFRTRNRPCKHIYRLAIELGYVK